MEFLLFSLLEMMREFKFLRSNLNILGIYNCAYNCDNPSKRWFKRCSKKESNKINNIPLLSYTIRQCKDAGIQEIYTSSNDQEILEVAQEEGSNLVFRPNELSSDFSTSESGWIHAIDNIPNIDEKHDWIFAPQVTSPLREKFDIENGIEIALNNKFDSIFSAVKLDDFLIWKKRIIIFCQ